MRNNRYIKPRQAAKSSWEESAKWYEGLVGDKGHYYHQNVILPRVAELLKLDQKSSLLDVGCGQGVLARAIPSSTQYFGIDAAPSLVQEAKLKDKNSNHRYQIGDATKSESYPSHNYTHAAAILSLQNMNDIFSVCKNVASRLKQNGKFIMVLNHPTFRIPRQSGWETFESNKLQYRWITKYQSKMEIPMVTHLPGGKKINSISYHYSLEDIFNALNANGLSITKLEELASDKESQGRSAKKENRARQEIPLFMLIIAEKK